MPENPARDDLITDVFATVKTLFCIVRSQQTQIENLVKSYSGLIECMDVFRRVLAGEEAELPKAVPVDLEASARSQRDITELERLFEKQSPSDAKSTD